MAVIQGGVTGSLQEVETRHLAARVTSRPQDIGVRGSYRAAFVTGVLPAALAANSEIFQWRFVHASFYCVVRGIWLNAATSTTAFAAGVPVQLEMRQAYAWTVVGTGGTGITFGTDDGKKKASFATTVLVANDVRVATTAALGAGTKTLHGVASSILQGPGPASTAAPIIPPHSPVYLRESPDEWPFIYENQQGFVIRSVEVPATGTWKASVIVEWSEIDPAAVTGWS